MNNIVGIILVVPWPDNRGYYILNILDVFFLLSFTEHVTYYLVSVKQEHSLRERLLYCVYLVMFICYDCQISEGINNIISMDGKVIPSSKLLSIG